MANKLWWGYRDGGKIKVFPYYPASDQWEMINKAEKSTFDVYYPFYASDEESAVKAIKYELFSHRDQ